MVFTINDYSKYASLSTSVLRHELRIGKNLGLLKVYKKDSNGISYYEILPKPNLLHFSYFHSDIHRKEYWPKLTDHLNSIGAGEYTKNRPGMFAVLKPYMKYAIGNAKRLDAENKGKTPTNAAPGTRVFELIEKLEPYLTEE